MYNGCIEVEQKSYDNLRRRWASISPRIRNYCIEVAEFAGSSYNMLDGCITMEERAAREKKSFSY